MEHNEAFDLSGISLKSLLQNAHIGVVIHRWDTSIVYANPTAIKLLRLTYDQIIGKDAKDPKWQFIDESGRSLQIEEYPVCKVKRFKSPLSNEVLGLDDSSSQNITWFNVNAYHEMDQGEGFIVVTFMV
jgi:PAS domain-containing protein